MSYGHALLTRLYDFLSQLLITCYLLLKQLFLALLKQDWDKNAH